MAIQDPDERDNVDEAIARNELEIRAESMGVQFNAECPTEMGREFLNYVDRWENAPWTTQFEQLERAGFQLPPPESLDDAALHAKLWELIHKLAEMNTTLSQTDHLSDRELYAVLYHDLLREETKDLSDIPDCHCHLDILGSYGDEETRLSFKYYADEDERRSWMERWPDYDMPAHEDPPYDRDRLLP